MVSSSLFSEDYAKLTFFCQIGTPYVIEIIKLLTNVLTNDRIDVRLKVVNLFCGLDDDRAIEPLITALQDEDYQVSGRAAVELAAIDAVPARNALEEDNKVQLVIYHPEAETANNIARQLKQAGYTQTQICNSKQEAEEFQSPQLPIIRIFPVAEVENKITINGTDSLIGFGFSNHLKNAPSYITVWAFDENSSPIAIRLLIDERLALDQDKKQLKDHIETTKSEDKRAKLRKQLNDLSSRYSPDIQSG